MKKLRVLLLVHEELLPPPDADELDWEETYPYQMELDVQTTLRALGHEVETLGVGGDLDVIRQKQIEFEPDIAFNILTDFHDITSYEAHVVSYLELLKLPYTGCNPRGITLSNDKALCKQILIWHGIPCPEFTSFRPGRSKKKRLPDAVDYPVIVKSAIEHGSTGISQASVVKTDRQLEKRVDYMFDRVGGEVIAEEFVEGRELTVSIVGNGSRLTVLPVWEVWYSNLPETKHAICTEQVKWDVDYAQSIGIKTGRADLPVSKQQECQGIARKAYQALGLSGYARMDLRMDEDGNVFVIEANVNPDLTEIEDFSEAAQEQGLGYDGLLQLVLESGVKHRAPWKAGPNKKYR